MNKTAGTSIGEEERPLRMSVDKSSFNACIRKVDVNEVPPLLHHLQPNYMMSVLDEEKCKE